MFKVCDYADLFLLVRKKLAKTSNTNGNRPNVVSNSVKASSKYREKRPDRPSLEGGQPIIIHIGSMQPFIGRLYYLMNDRILSDSNRYGVAAMIIPTIYFSLYGKVDSDGVIYLVDLTKVSLDRFDQVPHTRKGLRVIHEELKAAGYRI